MALYEFRCKTCEENFEVRRPMSEAGEPALCPAGHDNTVRLLSVFASVGGGGGTSPMAAAMSSGGGGGCGCGSCGCG